MMNELKYQKYIKIYDFFFYFSLFFESFILRMNLKKMKIVIYVNIN